MDRIVFFRIAWMEHYGGALDNDTLDCDASWVKEHGYCYEMFNFKPENGDFLGFVEPKGSINIGRLGAGPSDEFIKDVNVIWVATAPRGGTVVVGWYLHAVVFRKAQMPPPDSQRSFEGNRITYNVRASVKNCVLLPVPERTVPIPTKKGGIGQSNIWYADDKLNPSHEEKKNEVWAFIKRYYDEHSMQCQCGVRIPITRFTEGKVGKCGQCGATITVRANLPPETDQLAASKRDQPPRPPEKPRNGQATKRPDEIFRELKPAVVKIRHDSGAGSGLFVSHDGLIATNKHVVLGGENLEVELYDGSIHAGKVLKYYRDLDLAFLKIKYKTESIIKVNKDARLEVGVSVYAIGHPHGCEWVLTNGLVSKLDEKIGGIDYILTNAAIEPGNSGGPLINEYGQLVGINTMGLTIAAAMNFAIPVKLIWEKLKSIDKKVGYLDANHFCTLCYNTSFNRDYCDHCGISIGEENGSQINDEFTIKCSKCMYVFDSEVSICPNCGTSAA